MPVTTVWIGIAVGCLGCYLLKLAGLSVPKNVLERPAVHRIAALLPVVLLAALIAVQTFSDGKSLVIDARVAGLAVAAVAVWRRWPFLVVVALAAVTTALVRQVIPAVDWPAPTKARGPQEPVEHPGAERPARRSAPARPPRGTAR